MTNAQQVAEDQFDGSVTADFARTLELELTSLQSRLDDAMGMLAEALDGWEASISALTRNGKHRAQSRIAEIRRKIGGGS